MAKKMDQIVISDYIFSAFCLLVIVLCVTLQGITMFTPPP